jgi:hypothetical protein
MPYGRARLVENVVPMPRANLESDVPAERAAAEACLTVDIQRQWLASRRSRVCLEELRLRDSPTLRLG